MVCPTAGKLSERGHRRNIDIVVGVKTCVMECHRYVQDEELLDSDDEEGERLNNAKELAGMRVRHDADELGEGETMILTLADRNILDEHGDVDEDKDELENALVVCFCGASLLGYQPCCIEELVTAQIPHEL